MQNLVTSLVSRHCLGESLRAKRAVSICSLTFSLGLPQTAHVTCANYYFC